MQHTLACMHTNAISYGCTYSVTLMYACMQTTSCVCMPATSPKYSKHTIHMQYTHSYNATYMYTCINVCRYVIYVHIHTLNKQACPNNTHITEYSYAQTHTCTCTRLRRDIYAYIRASMYGCLHTCTHSHNGMCTNTYALVHSRMHAYTNTQMQTCTRTSMHIILYVDTHTCATCMPYIDIHIRMHAHDTIHRCTHLGMCV
jgi:hypothetical protein